MRFRRWCRELREDSPSFLTSLLFHMTIVILLGAAIPHPTRVADMGPLVVTFANGEQATETSLTMQASGNDKQEAEEQSEPIASIPAAARQEVDTPAKESSPDAPEDKVEQEPTVVITQIRFQVNGEDAFKRWLKDPTIFPVLESQKSDGDGRFSEQETERQDDIGNRDHDVRPRDHDDIVNRFIRYDIGRLPGRAGQLAVHDFQELGSAAIPALVRGLNKAATIGASCPIVVISNKLDALLHQADDTRLTRYAVENMGRHLSHRAPHVRRVRLLRAKWRNRLPTEELALDK